MDAIERSDVPNLLEELGDLYLVATMICAIEEEDGRFSVARVLENVREKIIRRHPHVFGEVQKDGVDEILVQWEQIKRTERDRGGRSEGLLDSVPAAMPPLERALALQKKASKVGFDWPDPEPVFEKLQEEIAEIREAVETKDRDSVESEVGDLLFSVLNLARLLDVDASRALAGTNRKFIDRFGQLERRVAERGSRVEELSLQDLDRIWDRVKREE
jgi:tetrapyrrole methylase family protein/MazG family protein